MTLEEEVAPAGGGWSTGTWTGPPGKFSVRPRPSMWTLAYSFSRLAAAIAAAGQTTKEQVTTINVIWLECFAT